MSNAEFSARIEPTAAFIAPGCLVFLAMYREYDRSLFNPRLLHDSLYAGAIIRFRELEAMRALGAASRTFIERFLSPHDPTKIHRYFEQGVLAATLSAAQREFANTAEIKHLWQDLLTEVRLDSDTTARDRLILRFQPPHPSGGKREWARSTATVNFHRDSWGTNLYAQVNWWAPIYPITAGRTFPFYPNLFAQPLVNSSADFDIADVIRRNREATETVRQGDLVPRLLDEVDPTDARPVTIDPGEIIAFSAQHAHVGIQNYTDYTRVPLDTRTLQIQDLVAGRGARNVDGRARWIALGMFRRVSDGKPLPEVLSVEPISRFDGPWPS